MWAKIGLLLSASVTGLSLLSCLVFLSRICLWTYGAWPSPIPELIPLGVWLVLLAGSLYSLRYCFRLYQSQQKEVTE